MAPADNKTFIIDKKLVGGQADVQLTLQGPDNDAVVLAVAKDKSFPDGQISLANIKFSASSGPSIPFSLAGSKDKISFNATADSLFAAGVYDDSAALLKDLSPERDIAAGVDLTVSGAAAKPRYLMIRCGYDVGVTAKGTMALGVGASANFGGSASRTADYGIVHAFQKTDGAHDVVAATIGSWILPSQFESADDIQPGTWIVTEVDGSVAVNVGVQAGYDYSWMRKFPTGELKGDLGLKVHLAANAALGFSANGTFALVLARETGAPVFRLRLYKLAKNGWNFAFNASAGEQVTLPTVFQKGNANDLISAVFGVHVAQLVQDLQTPINPAMISKFIETRGMNEFTDLTGVNPDQILAAGKAKVDQFVNDWNALTNKPATMLAKILSQNKDISDLTTFLKDIQGADQSTVTSTLAKALGDADFFQSPVGQFINSTVLTTPLGAIMGSDEWKTVQTLAGKALNIINGQTLQTLIDYAGKNLGLDVIQNIKTDVDKFSLDSWLQAKLATFLGKDPTAQVVIADVQKVQKTLSALLADAEKFYQMAVQAVQKQYSIALTSTYQKSTTSTALLDVSFDLGQNPDAVTLLQQAINGDMRQILLQKMPGVTLASATLTHDINRQGHSAITMPFIDFSHDDVTDSLASVSPVEDNGRVLVYNLTAQNEDKTHAGFFRASAASDSKLVFGARIPVPAGVTQFSTPAVNYGYTLTKAVKTMGVAQFARDLQPLIDEYMPGVFAGNLNGWVTALDAHINKPSTGMLGQTLYTFDVSLPPAAFQAWFQAPANGKDPRYFAMSKAIQRVLRQMIPYYYFANLANYSGGPDASRVLVYQCLPPMNGFNITDEGQAGTATNDVYFDQEDNRTVPALMNQGGFGDALQTAMNSAYHVLLPISKHAASYYQVNTITIRNITQDVLKPEGSVTPLLRFEARLISAIVQVGQELSKFVADAASAPSAAITQLSRFGDTFVQAFNKNLGGNLVAGSYLRGLGSRLMVEAARALAPDGAIGAPAGMLRLTVFENDAALTVDNMVASNFGNAKVLDKESLVSIVPLSA